MQNESNLRCFPQIYMSSSSASNSFPVAFQTPLSELFRLLEITMKLSTALVGLSMAFGTLTIAAPAKPPPPNTDVRNITTIQSIKDCVTPDCECSDPFACASIIDLDLRGNGTTNATAPNTAGLEDCFKQPREHLCWSHVNLDIRFNTTANVSDNANGFDNNTTAKSISPNWKYPSTWFMPRDPCCSFLTCHRSKECLDYTGCYKSHGAWVCPATTDVEARELAIADAAEAVDAAAAEAKEASPEKQSWEWPCIVFFNPIC